MSFKTILIGIAIFAAGGGAGFFVGKKVYEGYYAAIAQEEIDSVKERFERHKDVGEPKTENGMTDEEYEKRQHKGNAALIRSSLDDNPNEKAKRNYNLIGGKKHDEDGDSEDSEEQDEEQDESLTDAAGKTEEEMATAIDRTQPYIIDDREFSDEFDHHDKISLYYYRVDDVLCDEQDEVIDDIEETVGYGALSALDTQTTVWVRNEPLCTDYEIISIDKSYKEATNGIVTPARNLTPREQYEKRSGNRA